MNTWTHEHDEVPGKICAGACGEWKSLPRFARQPDCAGGRRSICTTCEGRVAYAKHPETCKRSVRSYQKSPIARGGKHEPGNVVPACRRCNFNKHTMTREEYERHLRASKE